MQPVNLFDLASLQARWLGVRQAAIAGNIANINTPGYTAVDVEPFASVLDNRRVTLGATEPGHIAPDTSLVTGSLTSDDTDIETSPSGNTVSLEGELLKSTGVQQSFELNTAIVKAFHSMLTMVAKG